MHAYNTRPRVREQTGESLLEYPEDITTEMVIAEDEEWERRDPEGYAAAHRDDWDPAEARAILHQDIGATFAAWRKAAQTGDRDCIFWQSDVRAAVKMTAKPVAGIAPKEWGPFQEAARTWVQPWKTPQARARDRERRFKMWLGTRVTPVEITEAVSRMSPELAKDVLQHELRKIERYTPERLKVWIPMLHAKIAGTLTPLPTAPHGHGFKWAYDQRDQRALPWTIDGVAVAGSWGYITADTRMGKTFLVSHLALCIYTGRTFFGREIRQRGGTLIVAGEAAYATPQRIEAGLRHNFPKTERPAIAYCGAPPNLLNPQTLTQFIEQLRKLSAEMQARHSVPLRMVAFDTLAKCFLVNEDKASEVVQAHNAMERIAEALQVVVITAAHVGKDHTKGTRGSSAHEQNAHFVLKVPAAGVLKLTKQKEAPDDIVLGKFDMPIIELGQDDRGKAITSRAIQELTSCPFGEVETPELATRSHRILRQALKAADANPSAPIDLVKSKFLPLYPQGKHTNAKQSAKTALRTWQRLIKNLPSGVIKGAIAGVECLSITDATRDTT